MALKQRLTLFFSLLALFSGAMMAVEYWRRDQVTQYNVALNQAQYDDAAKHMSDHGLFAKAYGEQQLGEYQKARVIYSQLEKTDNKAMRLAVLFNMGNTYLQQALLIDMEANADLALPLIELAKVSYREVLSIDSQHWDAKYNLERTLQLLPDLREKRLYELEGPKRNVRTVISAETEDNLP